LMRLAGLRGESASPSGDVQASPDLGVAWIADMLY
jgi:hypothetical protein